MNEGRGIAGSSFGLRAPASALIASRPRFTHLVLAAFALGAALVAIYVWFEIIKVPLERPVGPLFDNPRTVPREGWAPWHVAPLASFVLTFTAFWLYFRKSHRWTVLGLVLSAVIAMVLGSTTAYWIKNIGYTWYSVPGATLLSIASVQGPMFGMAFGRGTQALIQHAPLAFPAAALVGVMIGFLLKLPLRCTSVLPARSAGSLQAASTQQAGFFGRLLTTALMTAFVTSVAAAGMPAGALLVVPLVALTWWFVSFRYGEYNVTNMLIGSGLHGLLSTVPLVLALFVSQGGLGDVRWTGPHSTVQTLALGLITRTPVYLLVAFVLIRITLMLSRVTAKLLTKTPLPWRPSVKPAASGTSLPAPEAGLLGRLATVVIMTLVITNDVKAETYGMAAIVALIVALIWWVVSFRHGRSSFGNMLAGSVLHASVVTIAMLRLSRGPSPSVNHPFADVGWRALESVQLNLAIELAIRTGAYLLVTFLMIRIALRLPRTLETIRRRVSG